MYNTDLLFDYSKEPSRDILCIDCRSFYASVECAARNLDPLTAKLVVMSYPSDSPTERGSGLILASSPMAKKAYNITNVSRARDLPYPYPSDLVIAAPRMKLYMQKNRDINNIYKSYTDEENHHVYSVDESFLDITNSLQLFGCQTAYELAKKIQIDVYKKTGIYTSIGIGDNPLLAKLALDNEAKHTKRMKAEWRYEDVPKKLWKIQKLTDFWGIGHRTAKSLNRMGIRTIDELAHTNYYDLKEKFGVLGAQLYAHAWGIDRSFLGKKIKSKEQSIGNSQVLHKDYTRKNEIELVIKEMADQVATRLRRIHAQTQAISLWIGFSLGYVDASGKSGFHHQMKIPPTASSKQLADNLLLIFRRYYKNQDVRNISVGCSKLIFTDSIQLDLFSEPEEQVKQITTDRAVDTIRRRYGFKSLIHANSLLDGGRAIARSSLVGGHAGGMAGIEGEDSDKKSNEKRIF
ncbi:excinuclease ABC subunit A [Enterococcus sp. JM4C]|uniref:Y-family DNA polymerase n=1 Tax=Candidatus Enterococcus huntleyi TaxID=1857217 RepID=UPI00137969E9|nr:Y-family DNA polymerase [Enterococcus sp. JM4C]KAF1297491.1 excinuclease ABC subunit A [Enterococcus sp. JM4C]